MPFTPKYTITPKIINALSRIEIVRHDIIELPITAAMVASLRDSARLTSTHYSTAIEGNLLTSAQVAEVINGGGHFPYRQKDEIEVQNYYNALEYIENLAKKSPPIQESDVKTLHDISFLSKQKPTPYRDDQNVIRSGKLVVYIPPKATDVPDLMRDLIKWIADSIKAEVPVPIIAGLAHYQFATIHPYYDGNDRTARLLATLILHKYGYDLKGIFSLEEYYAKNLQGYYDALTVGSDEDYYDGNRNTADLTGFLEYFVHGMAESFDKVCAQAREVQKESDIDQSRVLRNLSPQQRQILKLFIRAKEITVKEIAEFFKCNERQARYLCNKWVAGSFLEVGDSSFKSRTYKLAGVYEELIENNPPTSP